MQKIWIFTFFILAACAPTAVSSTTPLPTPPNPVAVSTIPVTRIVEAVEGTETAVMPLPTPLPLVTLEPTAVLTQNMPSLTPQNVTPTPSAPPIYTPPVTNAVGLKLVLASDPRWSAIIERVKELQGFYTLALSPNGELLAAVDSYDEFSRVYLWNVETGETKWVLNLDQPLATSALVFSPDGAQLAVGASGIVQNIFVWDVVNGNQLRKFFYRDHTFDMKFSPDNLWLAVAGNIPNPITLWNLNDESVVELGRGYGIDFVPNSPVIAIAKGQRSPEDLSPVYLLDLQSGLKEYLFSGGYYAGAVAISQDGQYLSAVVSNEEGWGNLRLLNLQLEQELQLEENDPGNTPGTQQITFSAKGHLAILQRELKVWSVDGRFIGSLDNPNIEGFIFTPDGSFLLTYGLMPLEVWELPTP